MTYDVERARKEWQEVRKASPKNPIKRPTYTKEPGYSDALWWQVQTNTQGHRVYNRPMIEDPTSYDVLLPEWKGTIFEEILNDYNAYCARFRIMSPGTTLHVHTDEWTPSLYVYFFVLYTNEHSFFLVQKEDKQASPTHAWDAFHYPSDGNVYPTRYDIPHAAFNGGTTPKVNLQFRSKNDL